jgi:hypothetical protein
MTIPRTSAWIIAAALPLLAACAAAAPAPGGSTLSMTEHQSITVAPGAVLTFDSVNDSRCPPGVQCVVAGKVVYSFTLKTGDAREQFTLTPAAPAFTSAALQGKQITLGDVAPPAREKQAVNAVIIQIVTP